MNPYASQQYQAPVFHWDTAAEAPEAERTRFIRKTYSHLAVAVLAFATLEYFYLQVGLSETLLTLLKQYGNIGWLVVLAAFMGVSFLADNWARNSASPAMQYAGLFLYVIAESLIFAPMIYLATMMGPNIVPSAALATLMTFGGLTLAVFVTGKDFSFLRTGLMLGGFAAMAFILGSMMFGLELGNIFVWAMIVLSAGYILYYTSNVLHHYHTDQHVAASLALFAAVALLFWYILQLFMRSRD